MKQQSYFMRHSLWRKRNWKNILKVALVLFLLSDGAWIHQHTATPHAYASATTPQAVTVYGQAGSFTTSSSGISATTFNAPRGLALDSSGDLYVSEFNNNRVLYFPSGSTTATRVYGQAGSFTTGTANNGGISANSLHGPTGLALDSSGNLYVADDSNHRVLYYPAGTTTATRVYGQAGSFTSNTSNNGGISANSLYSPNFITLDSSNNLYVTDYTNNRVLYYTSGSTTATRVYGQAGSFTSTTANNGGISANSLNTPVGIDLDNSNNLYVADKGNNRVLYYASGNTTATRVYGQAGSFTSTTANNGGISANSLNLPQGLTLDSSNNLYIADATNNRVLYYPTGSTTATRVYGQAGSFTSNTVNNTSGTSGVVSANSLDQPFGLIVDSGENIYVTDTSNHRVLTFQTSLSLITQPPTSTVAGATFSIAAGLIDVGSGGAFSDPNTISVAIKSGTGTTGATLSGTTSSPPPMERPPSPTSLLI